MFFRYRWEPRYSVILLPFGVRAERDGVTVTDDVFLATFGWLKLETDRANVVGGHITEGYHWYKAIGARLSAADDGLTFGTSTERGVCIHFAQRVHQVLGLKSHSALTVTVEDCAGLVEALGEVPPRA